MLRQNRLFIGRWPAIGLAGVGRSEPRPPSALTVRRSLPSLTGLRFIAALVVIIGHAGSGPIAAVIGPYSGVAVTFFFALSGFVLTYTYTYDEEAVCGGWRSFYAGRIARVYPLYLLGCTAGLVPFLAWHNVPATACLPGDEGVQTLSTMLLVQSWSVTGVQCLNVPAWSVSDEAFFYLLFPLAALLLRQCSAERLLGVLGVVWAACLLPSLFIAGIHPVGIEAVLWQRAVYYMPLMRLPTFLLGVVIGRLFTQGLRLSYAPLWVIAAACGIVVMPGVLSGIGVALIEAVLIPFLLLLIFALAHEERWSAVLLAHPVAVVLGEASYALYILHVPLRDWMGHGRLRFDFWPYLALLLAVAITCHYVVEQPARRAIRHWLS